MANANEEVFTICYDNIPVVISIKDKSLFCQSLYLATAGAYPDGINSFDNVIYYIEYVKNRLALDNRFTMSHQKRGELMVKYKKCIEVRDKLILLKNQGEIE